MVDASNLARRHVLLLPFSFEMRDGYDFHENKKLVWDNPDPEVRLINPNGFLSTLDEYALDNTYNEVLALQ